MVWKNCQHMQLHGRSTSKKWCYFCKDLDHYASFKIVSRRLMKLSQNFLRLLATVLLLRPLEILSPLLASFFFFCCIPPPSTELSLATVGIISFIVFRRCRPTYLSPSAELSPSLATVLILATIVIICSIAAAGRLIVVYCFFCMLSIFRPQKIYDHTQEILIAHNLASHTIGW